MRTLTALILAALILVIVANIGLSRYKVVPVGQGVVKYNRFSGESWRLNLKEGTWEKINDAGLLKEVK